MASNAIKKLKTKYDGLSIQAKASIWFIICSFLQKGITIITTPIFTRLMSTAEYGKFNVFTSWQSIAAAIVILNLPYGVLSQGIVKFTDTREQFTSALLGLMTVLTVAWAGIYLVFRDFINSIFTLTTTQMICMLLLIWGTSAFNFWAVVQRVDYKYRKLVAVTLFTSFAKPVLGIILVVNSDDKVTARILGLTIVELSAYIGLYVSLVRRGRILYDAKIWRYGLKFSTPLIPHYLSQKILGSADRIMIDRMISSEAAGIYSLAYQISQIMLILNQSLMQAIEPWYFKKLKDHKEGDIGRIVYITMLLVAMANLMVIVFAPEIIFLFAPPSYHDSIWVISPIAMSVFFMYVYTCFVEIEFFYEDTKWISFATLLAAGLNMVLNYIFIRIFGYFAAGYTTLFCYMSYSVFHYIVMSRLSGEVGKKVFDLKKIIMISAGFLVAGTLITVTYNYPVVRYGIIFIVFVVAFLRRQYVIDLVRNIAETRKK